MLEPHNVKPCDARQPHKGHPWYDRGGKKLWCDGRDAGGENVSTELRRTRKGDGPAS